MRQPCACTHAYAQLMLVNKGCSVTSSIRRRLVCHPEEAPVQLDCLAAHDKAAQRRQHRRTGVAYSAVDLQVRLQ